MDLSYSIFTFIISVLLAIIGYLVVSKLASIDKSIIQLNTQIQQLRIDITDIHSRVKVLELRVDKMENPFFHKSKTEAI